MLRRIAYKWYKFRELLQPHDDQSEHVVDKVVDGVLLLEGVGASLEQKVDVDVELSPKILSGMECPQSGQIALDEPLDSAFFLHVLDPQALTS